MGDLNSYPEEVPVAFDQGRLGLDPFARRR
jgi:hypothetical protein